jgi:hypothetical protein
VILTEDDAARLLHSILNLLQSDGANEVLDGIEESRRLGIEESLPEQKGLEQKQIARTRRRPPSNAELVQIVFERLHQRLEHISTKAFPYGCCNGRQYNHGSKLLMAFECKFYESTPGVVLGRTFVGLISDCGALRLKAFIANLGSEKLGLYFSKSSRPQPFLGLIPTDSASEERFIHNVEQELRKWA